MIPKLIALTVAAAACVLVAWETSGDRGLKGAAVGVGAGAVLALLSHGLTRWAQRAEGQAIYLAMYASMLASLGIVVAVVIALSRYWTEILQPAAITMVTVYLAFRLVEVLRLPAGAAGGCPGRRGPVGAGPAGGGSPGRGGAGAADSETAGSGRET